LRDSIGFIHLDRKKYKRIGKQEFRRTDFGSRLLATEGEGEGERKGVGEGEEYV
jgi:hypothetical protein